MTDASVTEAPVSEQGLRYLSAAVVARHLEPLDPCAIVREALVAHASGRTLLPDEAYLGWTTPAGAAARSLAMPGALLGADRSGADCRLGVKIINASVDNPARGLPRAQGLVLLFDPVSGRVQTLVEAARISATRTAAASVVAAAAVAARPPRTMAVLGAGALARAHLDLAARAVPSLESVRVMDTDRERAAALVGESVRPWPVEVVADAAACVADADLVLTCTTTTEGYLPLAALAPGAVVVHVSLDDVLPEVVLGADLVVVDDWRLVGGDRRRLLGRMIGTGEVTVPAPDAPPGRLTTVGELLLGRHPGRRDPAGVVLVNPFGMAVLDIALAEAVARSARADPEVVTLPV